MGFHNKSYLALIAFILCFGIVMIYDATAVFSQSTFGEAFRLVLLQVGWIMVGSVAFIFFYKYDYRKISKIAYPLFGFTLLLLVVLSIFGILPCTEKTTFTPCVNGANRWFYLNPKPLPEIPFIGILSFQPSELAKLALILYLAVLFAKKKEEKFDQLFSFLVVSGLVSFLIFLQPNLSNAFLIFVIGFGMYIASNAILWPVIASLPVFSILGFLFIFTSEYRKTRFLTLINSKSSGELSVGYHIKQILIALGSGGLFGVGFGQSRQKFQYLPEVASDSIFAIIGEELGYMGTLFVILMFGALIYKGFKIASDSSDLVGRLLAVGITVWIGSQFFINVAAMTRLIPLTGMPIPLISYGGSSMVFSLAGLGVLGSVGRSNHS